MGLAFPPGNNRLELGSCYLTVVDTRAFWSTTVPIRFTPLALFTLLPHGPFGQLLIFKMPCYSKEGLQSLWKKKRRVSSLPYFMGLHNVKQWVDFTSKYTCSIKHQVQSKLLFLIKKICKANPKLMISSYTVVQQNIYTSFQSTAFFSAAQKTCSGQTVTEIYIHFVPSHVNTSALPFLNDHILKWKLTLIWK